MIYALVDPRDQLVHYVGKTFRGLARPKEGFGRHEGILKIAWFRELKVAGLVPETCVLQDRFDGEPVCWWLVERNTGQVNLAECWWIAFGRVLGWPLTNQADGGVGAPGYKHKPEALAKMSAAAAARWLDPVYRESVLSKKRGKPMAEETKAKIGDANRGRKRSTKFIVRRTGSEAATARFQSVEGREHQRRMVEAARTPEVRAKISAASMGRKWTAPRRKKPPITEETRAKLSAAHKGKKPSLESKLARAEGLKRAWADGRKKANPKHTIQERWQKYGGACECGNKSQAPKGKGMCPRCYDRLRYQNNPKDSHRHSKRVL